MFEYAPNYNGLSYEEYVDFRNDEDREFLTALCSYSDNWKKYGFHDEDFLYFYHGEVLSVAFDICAHKQVLRAMRIDLTETNLLLGEDETAQYISTLNPNNPEVKVYLKADYSITELAELSAKWIDFELSRKIELHEWINFRFHHRQWIMADNHKIIMWSDSKNILRKLLGKPTNISITYPK